MKLPKDVAEALKKQEKSVRKSPGGKAKRRVAQKRMARADTTAETTTEDDESPKTQE